jgi:acyl phosphate:glycerol-3-phosphate acyltransferase
MTATSTATILLGEPVSGEFWGILVGGYLLGSVPSAYLAAKRACGIDLRKYGSGNIGATNLLRFTSRRTAAPVIVFDSLKGIIMVVIAWQVGLPVIEQLFVGLAAIVGHNWPVFLRFSGGRGVITTLGVGFIIPVVNSLIPLRVWPLVAGIFVAIALVSRRLGRLTVGVFITVASFPLIAWLVTGSLPLTLGYVGLFLVLVIRRLTAAQPVTIATMSKRQVLTNRLLFDSDIRDKAVWTALVREQQSKQEKVVCKE